MEIAEWGGRCCTGAPTRGSHLDVAQALPGPSLRMSSALTSRPGPRPSRCHRPTLVSRPRRLHRSRPEPAHSAPRGTAPRDRSGAPGSMPQPVRLPDGGVVENHVRLAGPAPLLSPGESHEDLLPAARLRLEG